MPTQASDNPYTPGTGIRPPHLAGRVSEKSEIATALARINKKSDTYGSLERVSPPLVLTGPRGVGKTVLLDWAERKARQHGLQSVALSEKLLGGPEEFLDAAVRGKYDNSKAACDESIPKSIGHAATIFHGETNQTTHLAAVLNLSSILDRQLNEGPLLVMLDEAHAVAAGLLKEFCIDIQEFVRRNRPLALVMAGTPGLEWHLNNISATFMERSEIMPLNLLAKEEAREALSEPAAQSGVPMDDDALEALVEWTDCYPYFIQLAGRSVWVIAKDRGANAITIDDARKALKVADNKRRRFFNRRYHELVNRNIIGFALQAIELVEAQPNNEIGYKKLIVGIQNANEGMVYERAVEIKQSLLSLGFIFDNGENYEAGIPSLFDFVKQKGVA